MRLRLSLVAALLALAAPACAEPPGPKKLDPSSALSALTGNQTTASLSGNLRALIVESFPDPLFEDQSHWGKRRETPRGKLRNDGRWWKVRVAGRNVKDSLVVDLRDLQQPGKGVTTFRLFVSFDAVIVMDRQTWKLGARLYSGETRARCRVRLTLDCEALAKFEKGKKPVPDAVFRLRVLRSDLAYDNLVVEHTAGVGGETAKVLGDAVIGGMRQWKPSIERNLREKANAAIVKAADTKEVRVNLLDLFAAKDNEE
jgi:hypothetical protein